MSDGDREVMTSLPRSRPQRRSAKRDAPARKPAPRPKAAPKPKRAPKPKAKPTVASARKIPASGYAVPQDAGPVTPGGGELVSGAAQALGELANLGGRALRDALSRLPRP